jgi:hypothetical protein
MQDSSAPCIIYGHTEIAMALIERGGADVNNKMKQHTLHCACMNGHTEVAAIS